MNFIVPPFQSPDEPQHFSAVMVYALGSDKKPEIIREIIQIMERNNWWRFVGMGKQDVLPKDFTKQGYLTFPATWSEFQGISLYHFLLGRLLRILKSNQIISSYYICRFFSILLVSFALAFIGRTFQRAVTAGRPSLIYAPLFVLFLPQFMLMTVSVNPDVFSIFLGAVFFYAALLLLGGEARISRFVVLIIAAIPAFFTDRSVYSLIVLLMVFPFFMFRRKRLGSSLLMIVAVIVVAVVVAALAIRNFPWQVQRNLGFLARDRQAWMEVLDWVFLSGILREFIQLLVDSFYLKFGWMAFSPAQAIKWLWRGALFISWFGLSLYFIRRAISKKSGERRWINLIPNIRKIIFSLFALGLQLTGLLVAFGWTRIFCQGRYFFPMMTAVALLFVTGISFLFESIRKKAGVIATGVFVFVEFFLLNYIVWNDIVPVFHLTLKPPHPGL
jgi:hypothetical protein